MIERWSSGLADANMAQAILVDLEPMVRRHPWWQARARLTLDLLGRVGINPPSRVIDVGCGWGTTLLALERRGYAATGADISHQTLDRLDRPDRTLVEIDLAAPWTPPDNFLPFDAALALDVIEHIDDDCAAVAALGQFVRPGGVVIVSVPALPDLFNEFDQIQGHRRRYLPKTLQAAFAGSGLILDRWFWWGSWMVPLLRQTRGKNRSRPGDTPEATYARYLKLPPWPAPLIFRAAFALEHHQALAGRLGQGTSLFAVARKPRGIDSDQDTLTFIH